MSRGHTEPISGCDRDCAAVNGCTPGGVQCCGCGLWFCGDEIEWVEDRGCLCGDCAAEAETEDGDDVE